MGKRGPTKKYDFTLNEYIIDASKLSSFKSLLSTFNRGKDQKIVYEYNFKNNSSKVTAIRNK